MIPDLNNLRGVINFATIIITITSVLKLNFVNHAGKQDTYFLLFLQHPQRAPTSP